MDPENAAIAAEQHEANRAAVAKAARERAEREARLAKCLSEVERTIVVLAYEAKKAGFFDASGSGFDVVERHDCAAAYVWRSFWRQNPERKGVQVSFAVRLCDGAILRADVTREGNTWPRPDHTTAAPVDIAATFDAWKDGVP